MAKSGAKQRAGLTPRQAKFVREYAKSGIGSRAAISAGYAPGSADVEAARLLGKARIRDELDRLTGQAAQKASVSVEDVLCGLKREAEGKEDSTGSSRVAAWMGLGKALQMFVDRVNHEGSVSIRVHDPYAQAPEGDE